MSITQREERRVLGNDEFDVVRATHYPHICDLDQKTLKDRQQRLRALRDKARTQGRQQRRQARGKGKEPPSERGFTLKEQAFVGAMKRVNRELSRFHRAERRESQREIMLRALEQKRAARKRNHPSAGRTPETGMSATPADPKQVDIAPSPLPPANTPE
ncbi:hypothetical protein [Caenispirillum salinarum]|uniref:hypothetical protein n=1 Tax=Caenispirillum salinarum TaxID=859058 RepID=UPI00384D9802